MSSLVKAEFIEKHPTRKFTYLITEKGKDYLASHSGPIADKDLKALDGYMEAWEEASRRNRKKGQITRLTSTERETSETPEEQIYSAIETLEGDLQQEILESLASMDPFRFEQVVVDLLFAMGYGGSREEAARVTKKSNDEGIDGIINEDRLGLDVIYVQAKRWQNTIGRKEIQSFVGALAGKQVNKGVFITTSGYATTATDYAAMVTQKVILIDGLRLSELMIEHNIGVSTVRTISLKRLDSDYFEDN